MRLRLQESLSRLRRGWLGVVEATAAASLAWYLDTAVVGHPRPFFAPAAALIVLGQVRGERIRRTVEVLVGVAVGILIADLVVRGLGAHKTSTVVLVIALTLLSALVFGAGPVLTVQAAVSALYVAVVTPPGTSSVSTRFVDALVGGAIALVFAQLRTVGDPLRPIIDQLNSTFRELAEAMEQVAAALAAGNEPAARSALDRARAADPVVNKLRQAVRAADEVLWLRARRSDRTAVVETLDRASRQVDYAVRGVRVLARASVTLSRQQDPAPAAMVESIRTLASQTRAVAEALTAQLTGAGAAGSSGDAARKAATTAVQLAAAALEEQPTLPLTMLAGQIRMTAIDVLRAAHLDSVTLLEQLDTSLGLIVDH